MVSIQDQKLEAIRTNVSFGKGFNHLSLCPDVIKNFGLFLHNDRKTNPAFTTTIPYGRDCISNVKGKKKTFKVIIFTMLLTRHIVKKNHFECFLFPFNIRHAIPRISGMVVVTRQPTNILQTQDQQRRLHNTHSNNSQHIPLPLRRQIHHRPLSSRNMPTLRCT